MAMREKIKLHDKTFKPFIPNEKIEEAIDAVAARLNEDYRDCTDENPAIFLCTLNGALLFAAELLKRVTFPLEVKACKTEVPLPQALEGRRVLIVEDIVDTGGTIAHMYKELSARKVQDVRICTLLLKKDVYKKDVKLDYVAMEIPNRFIVGFGLDYDELGRNIPDIYVLDE